MFDVSSFAERHASRGSNVVMTMMTFVTPEPSLCGIVELDDEGRVQAFHEKKQDPPGNIANAATYILEPTVLAMVSDLTRRTSDFSIDVIPQFIGQIQTFPNTDYHRDIGTPASLAMAQFDYPIARACANALRRADQRQAEKLMNYDFAIQGFLGSLERTFAKPMSSTSDDRKNA